MEKNKESGFKTIPNEFASKKSKDKISKYFNQKILQELKKTIENDEAKIINIFANQGYGKTSTIETLIEKSRQDEFYVRFPIAGFIFDNYDETFETMREDLLKKIKESFLFNNSIKRGKNYPAKIFLSYCSEDRIEVNKYFDKLKNEGFDPWMDKRNILPGETWSVSINNALKTADFIIVFLTKSSIEKRGYYQKEITQALEYSREKLKNDIYLIPARLEECEIPDDLDEKQCANLYEKDGFGRLVNALKDGCKKRRLLDSEEKERRDYHDYESLSNIDGIFDKLIVDFPTVKFVIVLDDFDYFFKKSKSNTTLHKKFVLFVENIIHKSRLYLVTSSHKPLKRFSPPSSLELNDIDILEFDVANSDEEELINGTQKILGDYISFEEGVIEELVGAIGGNLFCYQLLFDGVIRYLNNKKKNRISHDDLKDIYDFVLDVDNRKDFLKLWEQVPPATRLFIVLSINRDNPKDFLRLSDLSIFKMKTRHDNKEVSEKILKYLVESNYIISSPHRGGKRYKIIIPLYAMWIARRYSNLEMINREFIEEIFPHLIEEDDKVISGSVDRSISLTQEKDLHDKAK